MLETKLNVKNQHDEFNTCQIQHRHANFLYKLNAMEILSLLINMTSKLFA